MTRSGSLRVEKEDCGSKNDCVNDMLSTKISSQHILATMKHELFDE